MDVFDKVRQKWEQKSDLCIKIANIKELENLHKKKLLPNDFVNYFLKLNGTSGEYDEDLFQFYAINEIKSLKEAFARWSGVPDY